MSSEDFCKERHSVGGLLTFERLFYKSCVYLVDRNSERELV